MPVMAVGAWPEQGRHEGVNAMRYLGKACAVCVVLAIGGPAMAQTSATQSTSVTTKIVQPISLGKDSDLAMGTVVKPTSGSNTVSVDATSAVRALRGPGMRRLLHPPPRGRPTRSASKALRPSPLRRRDQ